MYVKAVLQCWHLCSDDCDLFLVQLNSIADRTISEADEDGDSMISFQEFKKVSSWLVTLIGLVWIHEHKLVNIV